jgi:hypothetical protein
MDWIDLAQNRNQWRTVIIVVMVPTKCKEIIE